MYSRNNFAIKTVISLFAVLSLNLTHALLISYVSQNDFWQLKWNTITVLSSVGFIEVESAANNDPVSKTEKERVSMQEKKRFSILKG